MGVGWCINFDETSFFCQKCKLFAGKFTTTITQNIFTTYELLPPQYSTLIGIIDKKLGSMQMTIKAYWFPFSFPLWGPTTSMLMNDTGNLGIGKCKLTYWGSFKVTCWHSVHECTYFYIVDITFFSNSFFLWNGTILLNHCVPVHYDTHTKYKVAGY